MYEITLYRTSCDRKKLVKYAPELGINKLTKIGSTIDSFRIKEPSSIINPVILLSKTTVGQDWAQVTYAHIPSFGRWYFVDNIVCELDGLLRMELHVDVLQSYYSQLLNTQFEIARSESLNDSYYIDPELALQLRRVVEYKKIGSISQASIGNKYAITVAGGN